ncbi:MAG: fatty acid desaturase [Chloroflexota bacterium]
MAEIHVVTSLKMKPPKVKFKVPYIAWPTLLLFCTAVSLWCLSFWLVQSGYMAVGWGILINYVAAFAIFTPLHDASHRSVARPKWINEVIGRLSSYILMSPFTAFRYVHFEHHKHTNDEHHDPDYWSGKQPMWLLPFRWVTQDIHYYFVYMRVWKRRKVAERVETVVTFFALWGVIIALCLSGFAFVVILLWIVPSRMAIFTLAYTFDYLPHKPHKITSAENRFKATIIRPSPWLTPLFIYQNFHLIHHLYPTVPFYRYADVWRQQREYLISQGAEMRTLTGRIIEPAALAQG